MPGAKNGKYIIKNLAIGKCAPLGQDIKVTIADIPTELPQEFRLKLGDTLRYLPKSEVLHIKVKPTIRGMKTIKMDISNARQATSIWRYIVESQRIFSLVVATHKMQIPPSANDYYDITKGKVIDA